MKMLKSRSGFTLIEVIVVAGIIAVLAGILVPLIFKEIDESKKTRAAADIKSLSSAMMVMKRDTGNWPVLDTSCAGAVTLLMSGDAGGAQVPGGTGAKGFDTSYEATFDSYLSVQANGCFSNWAGPYIITGIDPWGKSYIVNAKGLYDPAKPPVWVISAGPNGTIDTAATDTSIDPTTNDDVGIRIQ